ncbi:putative protocadherin-1, partial [Triplophysa rosa]
SGIAVIPYITQPWHLPSSLEQREREQRHKGGRQLPHRRVTFSTANQAQDQQDPSQHSYYDSGLEESETPSSKSSSGPRIGPLALPEDHYERTTPEGSIGEMEHPENGSESPANCSLLTVDAGGAGIKFREAFAFSRIGEEFQQALHVCSCNLMEFVFVTVLPSGEASLLYIYLPQC